MQDRAAGAWRREEWLPQSVDEAVEEKVRTGGELAMLLDGWWMNIPAEFQYVNILSAFMGYTISIYILTE